MYIMELESLRRKCPNCGRKTRRTEDWACQWCGYPLLSKSYKKIPKTYRQLKEERLYEQEPPILEVEPEPEPEVLPQPEPEAIAPPQPEQVPEPEPEAIAPPQPEQVPEPEPEAIAPPQPEQVPEPEPEVLPQPQPEQVPEPEPEVLPQPEPELMLESISESTTMIEVTAGQLYSVYSADEAAADTKLKNKILKVTGVIDRIVVNDTHNVYYVMLTSAEKKKEWNVRCTVDRKYVPELHRLTTGQAVTVQGEYNGYKRNILVKDCIIVL